LTTPHINSCLSDDRQKKGVELVLPPSYNAGQ
jgi:hypothetical protein